MVKTNPFITDGGREIIMTASAKPNRHPDSHYPQATNDLKSYFDPVKIPGIRLLQQAGI
jgi:hypothetical protein